MVLLEIFHCEDYFDTEIGNDWDYYVRSPLDMAMNEQCVRVLQEDNLLVHGNNATGVSAYTSVTSVYMHAYVVHALTSMILFFRQPTTHLLLRIVVCRM